jgi:hypothetical protein
MRAEHHHPVMISIRQRVEQQVAQLVGQGHARTPPALATTDQVHEHRGDRVDRRCAVDVGIHLVGRAPHDRYVQPMFDHIDHRGDRTIPEREPAPDVDGELLGLAIQRGIVVRNRDELARALDQRSTGHALALTQRG